MKAFVFASTEPVTPSLLAPLLPPDRDPYDLLHAVRDHSASRGVILVEHGGGWVFRIAPDLAEPLQSALTRHRRLPRAAMEVLVVVALHQPTTRPKIEAIRGVGVGQATMDLLMETGMITAHGRRQVPGTPTLLGDDAPLPGAVRTAEPARHPGRVPGRRRPCWTPGQPEGSGCGRRH